MASKRVREAVYVLRLIASDQAKEARAQSAAGDMHSVILGLNLDHPAGSVREGEEKVRQAVEQYVECARHELEATYPTSGGTLVGRDRAS